MRGSSRAGATPLLLFVVLLLSLTVGSAKCLSSDLVSCLNEVGCGVCQWNGDFSCVLGTAAGPSYGRCDGHWDFALPEIISSDLLLHGRLGDEAFSEKLLFHSSKLVNPYRLLSVSPSLADELVVLTISEESIFCMSSKYVVEVEPDRVSSSSKVFLYSAPEQLEEVDRWNSAESFVIPFSFFRESSSTTRSSSDRTSRDEVALDISDDSRVLSYCFESSSDNWALTCTSFSLDTVPVKEIITATFLPNSPANNNTNDLNDPRDTLDSPTFRMNPTKSAFATTKDWTCVVGGVFEVAEEVTDLSMSQFSLLCLNHHSNPPVFQVKKVKLPLILHQFKRSLSLQGNSLMIEIASPGGTLSYSASLAGGTLSNLTPLPSSSPRHVPYVVPGQFYLNSLLPTASGVAAGGDAGGVGEEYGFARYDGDSLVMENYQIPNRFQLDVRLEAEVMEVHIGSSFIAVVHSSSTYPSVDYLLVEDEGVPSCFTHDSYCLQTLLENDKKCAPGSFKQHRGLEFCDLCPSQTFQGEAGSTECLPCADSEYCAPGQVKPLAASLISDGVVTTSSHYETGTKGKSETDSHGGRDSDDGHGEEEEEEHHHHNIHGETFLLVPFLSSPFSGSDVPGSVTRVLYVLLLIGFIALFLDFKFSTTQRILSFFARVDHELEIAHEGEHSHGHVHGHDGESDMEERGRGSGGAPSSGSGGSSGGSLPNKGIGGVAVSGLLGLWKVLVSICAVLLGIAFIYNYPSPAHGGHPLFDSNLGIPVNANKETVYRGYFENSPSAHLVRELRKKGTFFVGVRPLGVANRGDCTLHMDNCRQVRNAPCFEKVPYILHRNDSLEVDYGIKFSPSVLTRSSVLRISQQPHTRVNAFDIAITLLPDSPDSLSLSPSSLQFVLHVPEGSDSIMSGETTINIDILYTVTNVATDSSASSFVTTSSVRLRNVYTTVHLNAMTHSEYVAESADRSTTSLAIAFTEEAEWLLEEVEPQVVPSDGVVFMIIALLALHHTIHIFEFFVLQIVYRVGRCGGGCFGVCRGARERLVRERELGKRGGSVNGEYDLLSHFSGDEADELLPVHDLLDSEIDD